MVNDITEMLPQEPIEEESDAESDDSQKSSHSYLEGTEIYKTSSLHIPSLADCATGKQLDDAIQRRRVKLQKLKEITKKVTALSRP